MLGGAEVYAPKDLDDKAKVSRLYSHTHPTLSDLAGV